MTLVNFDAYTKPLCLSLLVSVILQLTTNMHWLVLVFCCGLLLLTAMFIYFCQCMNLIAYLWEISFSFIGLIIGFYLEFGITDIYVLYELCGQGNMAAIAPGTVKGMFVGCNIGMFMSEKVKFNIPNLFSLNLGMLTSMIVFEYFDSRFNIFNAPTSMLAHLVTMVAFGHMFYLLWTSIDQKKIKSLCFNYFRLFGGKVR